MLSRKQIEVSGKLLQAAEDTLKLNKEISAELDRLSDYRDRLLEQAEALLDKHKELLNG